MKVDKLCSLNKVYIFCVNFTGLALADYLSCKRVVVEFLDNDVSKQGTIIYGFRCIAPQKADLHVHCVIAATKSAEVIKQQLADRGFESFDLVDDEWKSENIDGFAPSMDDRKYLQFDWYVRYGWCLDLNNPRSFNEKIQWLKLHDRNEKYKYLVDKYEVKKIVAQRIGSKYVVPIVGVYDSFSDIDFRELPEQFVIKNTHDSGSTVICRDRNNFDIKEASEKINRTWRQDYFYYEREWSYKGIRPRVLIEELLIDENTFDINDYKFFCFDGEVKLVQVDFDRTIEHKRNLYSPEWEFLEASICYPNDKFHVIKKPDSLDEMLWCAKELSKGIPHVRIDLYYVRGRVYFGEYTFYHGGGYEEFRPKELGMRLGQYISVI